MATSDNRWAALEDTLRRANELTQQMVTVLDAFDQRLDGLQQSVAPVHSVTKKLTTISLNVDQAHAQLKKTIEFFDELDELRPAVLTFSIATDLPAYLQTLDRLTEAMQFLHRYRLKPGERIVGVIRALHAAGLERLHTEYANMLDRAMVSLETAISRVREHVHLLPQTQPGVVPDDNKQQQTMLFLLDDTMGPTIEQLSKYLMQAEELAKALGPVTGAESKPDKTLALPVPSFLTEHSTMSVRATDSMLPSTSSDQGSAAVATTTASAPCSLVIMGQNGSTFESVAAGLLARARTGFVARLLPVMWSSCLSASAFIAPAFSVGAPSSTATPTASVATKAIEPPSSPQKSGTSSLSKKGGELAAMSTNSIAGGSSAQLLKSRSFISAMAGTDSQTDISVSSKMRRALEDRSNVDVTAYAAVAYEKGTHPLIEYLGMAITILQAERDFVERVIGAGSSAAKTIFEPILGTVLQDITTKGDIIFMRIKRCVSNHDFSEIIVLFDLITSLGPHFDALEAFSLYCGKISTDISEFIVSLKGFASQELSEFIVDVSRPLRQSTLPPDGTVHELTSNTVDLLQRMEDYRTLCEKLLSTMPGMLPSDGSPPSSFGVMIVKVLEALGKTLEAHAHKTYKSRPLEAIFLLNNYHYMLKYLKTPRVTSLVGSAATTQFTENVSIHADDYHSSWKEVIEYLLEVNAGRSFIQGTSVDKSKIKERFKGFNQEFEQLYQAQQLFSIPDVDLRRQTRETVINMVVPLYSKFVERYANSNFTSNPSKYIKFTVAELESLLAKFFDTTA